MLSEEALTVEAVDWLTVTELDSEVVLPEIVLVDELSVVLVEPCDVVDVPMVDNDSDDADEDDCADDDKEVLDVVDCPGVADVAVELRLL